MDREFVRGGANIIECSGIIPVPLALLYRTAASAIALAALLAVSAAAQGRRSMGRFDMQPAADGSLAYQITLPRSSG